MSCKDAFRRIRKMNKENSLKTALGYLYIFDSLLSLICIFCLFLFSKMSEKKFLINFFRLF